MKWKPKLKPYQKVFLCAGAHKYKPIGATWIPGIPGYEFHTSGPGWLYRCSVCGLKSKMPTMFGRHYTGEYVSFLLHRIEMARQLLATKNSYENWHKALKEATQRRDFPNLLFAERWISALAKTGIYPSSGFRRSGD